MVDQPEARFGALTGNTRDPRIVAAIDGWKRKLLDLSMRNRLLNFRTTKVSTLTIVDEQPSEVFRRLLVRGDAMRFTPAPEAASLGLFAREAEAGVEELGDEIGEVHRVASDFAPYQRELLSARHLDDQLQTTSPVDQLRLSLLRIDTQARTTLEEQGVNTLFLTLGMVHYRESEQSEEVRRGPLVLLPVVLERRSARSDFVVRTSGDDPLVNPGLMELLRREVRVKLPELPPTLDERYDLQTLFSETQRALAEQVGWKVTNEIYLGLFSFQKFVMYKDLETHSQTLESHRLVDQIVTRAGGSHQGLPEEVRGVLLDDEFPPESTAQVIDADASQLRALMAVDRGYDLVMEGPPGTGKSQTITNLIAQALFRGKTVLFVAEKMAALQVVASRLRAAGLGEFCLELHSSKASKKAIVAQIASSLDASLLKLEVSESARETLPNARGRISAYVDAVHRPFGALGKTPYFAFGELEKVSNAPKLRLSFDPTAVVQADFDAAVAALKELAAAEEAVTPVREHPFRDSGRIFYTEDQVDKVREVAEVVRNSCDDTATLAQDCERQLGLPPIRTVADIELAVELAAVIARSPGAPQDVLASDAWNSPPVEAGQLISRGCRIRTLLKEIRSHFREDVIRYDPAGDLRHVEHRRAGRFTWFAWLDRRYRLIARQWRGYRLPSFRGGISEQIIRMRQVVELRGERSALAAADSKARALFGALWRGEGSNWDALDRYVDWVVEFRGAVLRHGLSRRAQEVASAGKPDVSGVERLRAAQRQLLAVVETLRQVLQAPPEFLETASIAQIGDRASALAANWMLAPRWAAFLEALAVASRGLAAEALEPALAGEYPISGLPLGFRRAFWMRWLEAVIVDRPELRAFHGLTHEQRITEFGEQDRQILTENQTALRSQLRRRSQESLRRPEVEAEMPYLRRELSRQRGHKPVRTTLREAGAAVRSIMRCFMMSPLTVAQLLDGSEPTFDLVVFDEASQVPTEDAIGAILRGRQLVVVGDPKQLPPTNFFMVATDPSHAPRDGDGNPLIEDTESVLEEFMGTGAPKARLKWHYRSTDESLIAFSNVSFYDSELMTFPSVWRDGHAQGLQFEYLPGGVYEGKGVNWTEARHVVDAVVHHASTRPDLSLGVGTFSISQQYAILDLLEDRRRQSPEIEPFFAKREQDGFFVKNLENIQGDERDVIFLSVAYARAHDGRLRYNFGPLNQQNGWRRLNVLVTRARQQMRVFSSIRGEDFRLDSTASSGARLLRDFLTYAESRRLDATRLSAEADAQSGFEREVFTELSHRGLDLIPQVGASGYRIDFGVVDLRIRGRFVCGIECDGASYHRSETARDRDRLREQVLRDRGWTIHRIWSTDWFKDRSTQISRILRLVEGTCEDLLMDSSRAGRGDLEGVREEVKAVEPSAPQAVVVGSPAQPTANPYSFAEGDPRWMHRDLLTAIENEVDRAVLLVAGRESPIHVEELASRVAALWGTRAGSRIAQRIKSSLFRCKLRRTLEHRGEFVWVPDQPLVVRSRASMVNPAADRIAPEEYQEAIRMILRSVSSIPRSQLLVEVRTLLGFRRTGPRLELEISTAIDFLFASGEAGEGSRGIALRTSGGNR